ncbi:uncharacterized protein YktB (UPF0637 family) [Oikeobacillus pervagus]|uniref:UPF0637 protein J2S13_001193 n=1 Tax=Oikeobacillus pervagus TaxID=1325931 RepID=A0AAJ1T142_9BACI|nr:DUF1054 domain-containing protein [Oikeobacillus pervagus]MDQ0214796.1 uncharacterized protein YktB (UPF0637 family) [Oikeobacillus pervagus]
MSFNGFTKEDFDVFAIEGLEPRMESLKATIRPKLDYLGNHFSPTLSALTGDEMFYHVAKHARRTVHPPNDTWVAFANNKRGYKKHPHFQIGLWGSHLFIWFAVIYEAPTKVQIGHSFEKHLDEIYKMTPRHFVWSLDHMKPDASKMEDLSQDDLQAMFQRMQTVKKAEILCGFHIPKDEAIFMSGGELIETIDEVFKNLIPLYKLASH